MATGWTLAVTAKELYYAAMVGDITRMRTALSNGADINHPHVANFTPLHAAARNNRTDAVKFLLENGAGIECRSTAGWTPLIFAAAKGHSQAVTMLLEKGADVTASNNDGETALDYAEGLGKTEVASLLRIHSEFPLYLYLHRGLIDGYVSLICKKLVLMGPPNVGKTAFEALLFNWPAPKTHHSTAIASRPVRAIERITDIAEGKVWDVVNTKDILKMLSDAISNIRKEDQSTGVPSSDGSHHSVSKSPSLETESSVPGPVDSTGPHDDETTKHKPDIDNIIQQEHTKKILGLLEDKSKSKGGKRSRELHKATWVHVLDSGGQPQFADVSRAFLRGNAVNVILVKLTEKLSDKPSFVYSLDGVPINAPSELQMTNLQLIEHFVRSVAASKNTCTVSIDGKEISTKPFFIVIGTYYDKATKGFFNKTEITSESIADKNQQILSSLGEFRDQFIFYDKSSNDLIFPVDNLCRINRKKISAQIRERIMSQEGIGFKVPIPIRWYLFELQMRDKCSDDHGIVSIESCYDIGTTLGMSEKDVKTSLVHFDSLTLCLYYQKVLPNVIFTNPQYLLDILSGLVRTSFVSDLNLILPKGKSLSPDTQQMLQRDGVFEKSIFNDLGLPFVESLFTPRDFLLLLQYLFVVSPIKSSDSTDERFFMPIVLPPERMSEEQKKVFSGKCDPLVITFNSKLVLQGLFPTLIVSLLSQKEKPHFFIDSRSRNFPQQLRYAISLYSEDLFGSIFLCDNLKSIEIIFTGLTRHCYALREVILECLSASAELLSYDMKALEISALVRCTRKHTIPANDSDPHPITISYKETPPVIGCSVETLPVELLDNERQSCWLLDSCTSSAPLTNASTNMPLEETAPIASCTTSATASTMVHLVPVPNTVVADTSVADTLPVETAVLNMSHAPLLIKAIRSVVFEWEILGTQLYIEPYMLQEIKYNCNNQVQVCRKEMIHHWIETGTATLQQLIEGLGVVGRNDLVADIKKLITK